MNWFLTALSFMFFWSTAVVLCGFAVELARRFRSRPEQPSPGGEPLRFACVICAHNEERVVARPIESILGARYPRERIGIFVLADNCGDRTAEIAAAYPQVTVLEKSVPSRGKGDVLAWGLDLICRDGGDFDAVAVFDADNRIGEEWFAEIDRALRSGAHVVTGHRMSSNPFANLITGWYTIYWNLMNELSNRVRSNLALSAMLTGTGFCFMRSVVSGRGWRTRTFVEDLEFAFFRNLEGCRIAYAPNAIFYDEQPVTARAMFRQLNRWATGGLQMIAIYSWSWLKALWKDPSLRLFDSFAVIALGATGSIIMLFNAVALNWRFGLFVAVLAWASAVLSTALSRYSIRSLLLAVLTFPVFTVILSITVVYSAVFPQRTWKPIEHGN